MSTRKRASRIYSPRLTRPDAEGRGKPMHSDCCVQFNKKKGICFMVISVHPAQTMLRGDGRGYNPRDIQVTPLPGNRELITGVFRDDGVGSTRRAPRPFRVVTPPGLRAMQWQSLNTAVFCALESGAPETLIEF